MGTAPEHPPPGGEIDQTGFITLLPFSMAPASLSSAPWLAGALVAFTLAAQPPARAAELVFPAAGVVCDPVGSICYDRQGVSLGLTETYFGRLAADRLSQQIGSRPPASEIRFSNGSVCSLREGLCWREGWGRRVPDNALSARLFGTSPGGGGGQGAVESGRCRLSRRGVTLFDGACGLRQVSRGNSLRYEVSLDNGSRFSFSNRSGQFLLNDSTGTWPVTVQERGSIGSFRWNDYQLLASRQSGGLGSGASGTGGSGAGTGAAVGAALGELLRSLFR